MNTSVIESAEKIVGNVCTESKLTERVSRYLDDPLNNPGAEEIEDHLLNCRACREFVDTMLSIRGEATRNARDSVQAGESRRLARISTYRK